MKRFFFVFVLFAVIFFYPQLVKATTNCSVGTSMTNLKSASTTAVVYTVNNTGDRDITSFRVNAQTGSIWTFSSGSASGWDASFPTEQEADFNNGSVSVGQSASFTITTAIADVALSDSWNIYATSDADDVLCGSISFNIAPDSGQTTSPGSPTDTPSPGPGGTTQTVTVTTVTTQIVTPSPTPTPIPDRTPPTISVNTDFSKPFKTSPAINGNSYDRSGVSRIDYSLDGGSNWLPVDSISVAGRQNVSFEFTPMSLDDGNYNVVIRSFDTHGNRGLTKPMTLIIDRLPPRIGPSLFAIGAQIVGTNGQAILTLPGINLDAYVSAAGGPTKMDLISNESVNSFKKNIDNGLWVGSFSFLNPGVYETSISAEDGALNRAQKTLNKIIVLDNGRITNNHKPIKNAKLTVYALDPVSNQFSVWDGAPYGMLNPQKTDSAGKYTLFIPEGTYYIRIEAPGYESLKTNIFTLTGSLPITMNFGMTTASYFQLGPLKIQLPDFNQTHANMVVAVPTATSSLNNYQELIGKPLPDFSFKNGSDTFTNLNLHGKKTVLTFLSTWLPQTPEQLGSLDKAAQNQDINVVAIIPQEKSSQVAIFRKKGGYSVPIVADPDGDLIEKLTLSNIPVHIFMDRNGIIQKIKMGVLNQKEIMDTI